MDFGDLEALKRFITEQRQGHAPSLSRYYAKTALGFKHRADQQPRLSISSTSTCVLSLIPSGEWAGEHPWSGKELEMARALTDKNWTSAGLPRNNPFTVAFMLEAVLELRDAAESKGGFEHLDGKIEEAIGILARSLSEGSVRIQAYPPNAYVTQAVVRVLTRAQRLPEKTKKKVGDWARSEIKNQFTLIQSGSKSADTYALAYSAMLVAMLSDDAELSPDDKLTQRAAFNAVFAKQLDDGSWPPSRPLFHYKKAGNAYCYEYEMLVQLLRVRSLYPDCLRHIADLRKAAYALRESAYVDADGLAAWASGHHPQIPGPESWSTASVFHFLHLLDRLVAEAIRAKLFQELDTVYSQPKERASLQFDDFAPEFLDSEVYIDGTPRSLRGAIWDKLVKPVAEVNDQIAAGRPLPSELPTSAILFGPPGTSKTRLSELIAESLGWPLLMVDPSHLVRNGMDRIQAEANRLFSMLASAEQVVVLLDEFDEMVRTRHGESTETMSRFLTTAMLPKLSEINKRSRIVFLLATNHIGDFDFAISRPGRFDAVLQVMPPTTDNKLKKWKSVRIKLDALSVEITKEVSDQLNDLTFAEFEGLVGRIESATTSQQATNLIKDAAKRCTLRRPIRGEQATEDDGTWKDACQRQRDRSR